MNNTKYKDQEKILITKGIEFNWKKAISHLPTNKEKFIQLSIGGK